MPEIRRFTPDIGKKLPRVAAAQAGVDPKWIAEMVDGFEKKGLRIHSFLLVRDGRVYSEGYYAPYHPLQFQTVYSLSKSFTSAAMGIAQGEGLIDLDEKLVDIFAEEIEQCGIKPCQEMRTLTLRNCLRMSTGQAEEKRGEDFIATFLANDQHEAPGQVFRYNTMATYMCSAALKKKGVDLESYLQKKLFDPLDVHGLHWLRCGRGVCTGGYGLSLLPELIAKFGVLVLQNGVWEGKQLIPAEYLAQATAKQIDNSASSPDKDWISGYGYQFWMCQNGCFRGDGMHGQLCVMDRQTNSVAAFTAFVDDIQAELDVYYDNVLDRMRAQKEPLPVDEGAENALKAKLAALQAAVEPVRDEGGEVPEAAFGEKESGAGKVLVERDGQALRLTLDGQAIHVERGALKPTSYTALGGWLGVKSGWEANACTGYGVQGGKLVIRLLLLEELKDLRLEIGADGKLAAFDVHDRNAPKAM